MPKFTVYGNATITVGIVVEADDKDAAIEVAYDEFGGLTRYCGNGGSDKLCGVSGRDEFVDAGCEVEFTDAEPAD